MSVTIQLRRDLAASWIANNPTLAQGEVGLEYDTGNLKVGNGVTPWAQLNYPGSPPNILKSMMPVRSSGIPAASAFLGSFVPPQPMTLPANCAGSFANAAVAATDAAVLNIIHQANGTTTQTVVGTITYAAGSAVGTFATTSGALVALNAGDTLYVQAPSTPDATLSDIAATLLIGQATVAISYVAGTDGTYAVFAIGNSTTTTNLYNYAANSVAMGTVLTSAGMSAGAAAGNSTAGVFALGDTTTTTNLYNYAANSVALGTVLTASSQLAAAAGNSTAGVFALGDTTTTTNLYNYAANSVALGTVLTASSNYGAAAGNSTAGVFALGNSLATTNLYNYAANTCSLMGYLTAAVNFGAAVSNGNAGVTI